MDEISYRKAAPRSKLAPQPDESKGVGVEFRPQGQEIEEIYSEESAERLKIRKKK